MHEKYGHNDERNRRYQRRLAAALVACEGRDGAVETCRGNGWEGVLAILMTERPVDPADGSPPAPGGN